MKTMKLAVLALAAGIFIPEFHIKSAHAQAPVFMCARPVQKRVTVGTTAVVCPTTQLSNRKLLQICNSDDNGGSNVLKVRIDGVAPISGTGAGDVYVKGVCVVYYIESGIVPLCVASGASTLVDTIECG